MATPAAWPDEPELLSLLISLGCESGRLGHDPTVLADRVRGHEDPPAQVTGARQVSSARAGIASLKRARYPVDVAVAVRRDVHPAPGRHQANLKTRKTTFSLVRTEPSP